MLSGTLKSTWIRNNQILVIRPAIFPTVSGYIYININRQKINRVSKGLRPSDRRKFLQSDRINRIKWFRRQIIFLTGRRYILVWQLTVNSCLKNQSHRKYNGHSVNSINYTVCLVMIWSKHFIHLDVNVANDYVIS